MIRLAAQIPAPPSLRSLRDSAPKQAGQAAAADTQPVFQAGRLFDISGPRAEWLNLEPDSILRR